MNQIKLLSRAHPFRFDDYIRARALTAGDSRFVDGLAGKVLGKLVLNRQPLLQPVIDHHTQTLQIRLDLLDFGLTGKQSQANPRAQLLGFRGNIAEPVLPFVREEIQLSLGFDIGQSFVFY